MTISLDEIRAKGRQLHQGICDQTIDQLLAWTESEDQKVARYAVRALAGSEGIPRVEDRLLEMWNTRGIRPEMQRALIRVLGATGGKRSLEAITYHNQALSGVVGSEKLKVKEDLRLCNQALLILQRRLTRSLKESKDLRSFVLNKKLQKVKIRLHTRNGLERFIAQDLPNAQIFGPGRIDVWHQGSLQDLLKIRGFDDFVISLPPEPFKDGEEVSAIVSALTSKIAQSVFAQLSQKSPRYRLSWQGEGRKNQLLWDVADALQKAWPQAINDPRERDWEIKIYPKKNIFYIDLVLRGVASQRFAYRVKDVPAASHPPLAAVLAKIAEIRAGDLIWDPFVGSATELIECAQLESDLQLIGSDRDPHALEAAKANINAAGFSKRIQLQLMDALESTIKPTLIITNPPLGRRVPHRECKNFLDQFLEKALQLLHPRGRMVWVSLEPEHHATLAQQLGFKTTFSLRFDLGGFAATIQRFDRCSEKV